MSDAITREEYIKRIEEVRGELFKLRENYKNGSKSRWSLGIAYSLLEDLKSHTLNNRQSYKELYLNLEKSLGELKDCAEGVGFDCANEVNNTMLCKKLKHKFVSMNNHTCFYRLVFIISTAICAGLLISRALL